MFKASIEFFVYWTRSKSLSSRLGVFGVHRRAINSVKISLKHEGVKVQSIPLIVPALGPPKNWHYSRFGTISDIFVN